MCNICTISVALCCRKRCFDGRHNQIILITLDWWFSPFARGLYLNNVFFFLTWRLKINQRLLWNEESFVTLHFLHRSSDQCPCGLHVPQTISLWDPALHRTITILGNLFFPGFLKIGLFYAWLWSVRFNYHGYEWGNVTLCFAHSETTIGQCFYFFVLWTCFVKARSTGFVIAASLITANREKSPTQWALNGDGSLICRHEFTRDRVV